MAKKPLICEGIAFNNVTERDEIRTRGLREWEEGRVPEESIALGKKYQKNIELKEAPKVSIRFINERIGHGVFAEELLKTGRYIGEYTGIVRENSPTYFAPLNNYCYEYPVPDRNGKHFVIDATQGNFTRFINHSYQPNLKPLYAFVDGFYHLIFLSLCQIQKGKQLSYDYGTRYWAIRSPPEELI